MFNLRLVFAFLLVLSVININGQISLPRFISDGMVLQRNTKIPIWGWASANEKVEVLFNGKTYATITDANKKWKLFLKPQKAGGPYKIKITASNTITIKNVLIGDVWLCSGQSNMEFELYKAAEKYSKEIAASDNNFIRHFEVKRNTGFNSKINVESEKGWQTANPTTVLNFTAVGYFFAKKLYEKYKVPIGLINCSYGGTPVEAWMNENTLIDYPKYYNKAVLFKNDRVIDSIVLRDKQFTQNWNKQIEAKDIGSKEKWYDANYKNADWQIMEMPNYWQEQGLKDVDAGIVWFKKEIEIPSSFIDKNATLYLGAIAMKDVTYFNGKKIGSNNSKYPLRKYTIANEILQAGKNIITVRVLNENGKAGFLKDKSYKLVIGDTSIDLKGDWQYKLSTTYKPLLREEITRFQDQGSALYHGMLQPLIGYGIKGVIWYQGESNVSRANEYKGLFSSLITNWRKEWQQGQFPFLFVQLANINLPKTEPAESKLATLQEAQAKTLDVPNTAMAVANDIGEWNDVHPLNKSEVGYRLSLAAQKTAYGDEKSSVFRSKFSFYENRKQ
jgi:sialate O-acetylesterase